MIWTILGVYAVITLTYFGYVMWSLGPIRYRLVLHALSVCMMWPLSLVIAVFQTLKKGGEDEWR